VVSRFAFVFLKFSCNLWCVSFFCGGLWFVVCGLWFVCGVWFVVCGVRLFKMCNECTSL